MGDVLNQVGIHVLEVTLEKHFVQTLSNTLQELLYKTPVTLPLIVVLLINTKCLFFDLTSQIFLL